MGDELNPKLPNQEVLNVGFKVVNILNLAFGYLQVVS
jgi:hypothetical protein